MNQEQIKQLEAELWGAADDLRANSKLTAAEYKDPVLGLILLRYAQNRYEEAKVTVEASIPEGPRGKRSATKEDFLAAGAMMLPEKAQYGYLANLPEGEDINEALNDAMRAIEEDYTDLAGILPKNYQELDAELLRELIRVFNKDSIKKLKGDVFGRIYEYFLMKFSMSGAGAQEGGEFFTPPSLVQLIVNFIEPDHGIIHDPACGSGGMFVQTGHFVENHSKRSVNEAITVYGTELKSNNTRLAKMNLAIHGIEGKIIESNSFYTDPFDLVGKCDFVMANPPFNVNKVDKKKDYVKTDKRLFEDVGIPKADNGNYLWIQYFYHYLNAQGRAGFVMASSATDAGASEKLIRQKLIETGAVDCIVAVGNNFFYTRSLPCHLWFLDKGKREENRDKILMIDARNTFRQVTQTLRDFSPEQMEELRAMVWLHRGEKQRYGQFLTELDDELSRREEMLMTAFDHLFDKMNCHFDAPETKSYAQTLMQARQYYESKSYKDAFDVACKASGLATPSAGWVNDYPDWNHPEIVTLLGKVDVALKAFIPKQEQSQRLRDWFPDNQLCHIEGLVKQVTLEDVEENDWSLTPGRYVGYAIQIDESFDYAKRLGEIHSELAELNTEAEGLMNQILRGAA